MWEVDQGIRPEQIASVKLDNMKLEMLSKLWIGVAKRTHDNSGLAVYPTYEVLIEINGKRFGLSPDQMRGLLPSISAYCDSAEALNKSLGETTIEKMKFEPIKNE